MEKQDVLTLVDNFKDVGAEISESIIDSFFDDGILKDIPIINALVSGVKTVKQVKDILFLRKFAAFIYGYGSLPAKIDAKVSNILESSDGRVDLGEKVLLIVEKVDSIKKAELIGRAVKHYKNGEMSSPVLLRLCHMIDSAFYEDLLLLKYYELTADGINLNVNATELEQLTELGITLDGNSMRINHLVSSGWIHGQVLNSDDYFNVKPYSLTNYGNIVRGLLMEGI